MKKLVLLAAIAIISGCSTLKPTERKIYTYISDYRIYSDAGFLITPQPYFGEHESLGEIDIHIIPAFEEKWNTYEFETISTEEIIDTAVKQAVGMGADAISNFSITYNLIEKMDIGVSYKGFEYFVKGFCIKRK